MSATPQVTVSRTVRRSRPVDDLDVAGPDPRPSAVRVGWSWRPATSLRDLASFWGTK